MARIYSILASVSKNSVTSAMDVIITQSKRLKRKTYVSPQLDFSCSGHHQYHKEIYSKYTDTVFEKRRWKRNVFNNHSIGKLWTYSSYLSENKLGSQEYFLQSQGCYLRNKKMTGSSNH